MQQYPPNQPEWQGQPHSAPLQWTSPQIPPQYYQAPPPPKQKKPWYQRPAGCILIIALILFCSAIGIVQANATQQQAASLQGATATVASPTATPTQIPTPTPKPHKTPTPVPTAKPTVAALVPTVKPTAKPKPKCNAVNNNPWCYNFTPGNLITNPPADFCSYFPCIATFVSADDPDGGYVVECSDGDFSQSGGESGSCSHHGGENRPLYSH